MNSMTHRSSVVLCPKAKLPASVDFDDSLIIKACSRSSALQSCSQDCLLQLHFAAEELENFVTSHQGQGWCRICGTMLTADDWYASRMAAGTARNSDRSLAIGENGQVCWNCYQAAA
jgi:hypothetical protein